MPNALEYCHEFQGQDTRNAMGFRVNGNGGPNWGQTAAQHIESLIQANPLLGFQTTIQYMNPANLQQDSFTKQTLFSDKAIDDAFDYSVAQTDMFDSDGDRALNFSEYAAASGVGPDTFQRSDLTAQDQALIQNMVNQFNTVDRNQNGFLEIPENTAYTMFQDDGTTILRRTLRQTGQAEGAEHLEAIAQQLQQENYTNEPIIADGQVTPTEQALSEVALNHMPTYTGEILDSMLGPENLNLSQRYQDFAQRQSSFQYPPSV